MEDNGRHRGWLRNASLKLGIDALRAHYAEQFSANAQAPWCSSMKKDLLQQMTARIRASRSDSRPTTSSADLENFARDVMALEEGLHRVGLKGWGNFRELTTPQGRTLLEEAALGPCSAPVLLHHCLLNLEDLTVGELSFALSLAARCKALQSIKKILAVARGLSREEAAEVLGVNLPDVAAPLQIAHRFADVEICEQLMTAMAACALAPADHVQLLLTGIQIKQIMSRSMQARWEGAIDNLCEDFPDDAKDSDFRALMNAYDRHLMVTQR
jgi:hypothetical protein